MEPHVIDQHNEEFKLEGTPTGGAAAQEGGHFVAIATHGHGAPAAPVGAGIVVEEEAARGIGTAANGGLGAFDEELRGGASQGRKQPIESTFAGYELQRPRTFLRNEFIMSLGDTEDFVDGLDPGRRDWFFVDDRS